MPNEKVFFNVPFSEKDTAKAMGARFDGENKLWYANDNESLTALSSKWAFFIDCPFSQKNEAKEKGAKWEAEKKTK